MPTLGFTHFPAGSADHGRQREPPCGCRIFGFDYSEDVCQLIDSLMMLGVKGTTGTSASFLDLLTGIMKKVKELDRKVVKKMGFEKSIPVLRSDIYQKN